MKDFLIKVRFKLLYLKLRIKYLWLDIVCTHLFAFVYDSNDFLKEFPDYHKWFKVHRVFRCIVCQRIKIDVKS
jgi:hypothetical protein